MSIYSEIINYILDNDSTRLDACLKLHPGINLEEATPYGITVAHSAASLGRTSIVDVLESHGANMLCKDADGLVVRKKLDHVLEMNDANSMADQMAKMASASIMQMEALQMMEQMGNSSS